MLDQFSIFEDLARVAELQQEEGSMVKGEEPVRGAETRKLWPRCAGIAAQVETRVLMYARPRGTSLDEPVIDDYRPTHRVY